jgi:hypothetical protein
MLVPEAGRRGNEQDGPPENAKMGHRMDAVEVALAGALTKAAAASEWAIVRQLAHELEARRTAPQEPSVADLEGTLRPRGQP